MRSFKQYIEDKEKGAEEEYRLNMKYYLRIRENDDLEKECRRIANHGIMIGIDKRTKLYNLLKSKYDITQVFTTYNNCMSSPVRVYLKCFSTYDEKKKRYKKSLKT